MQDSVVIEAYIKNCSTLPGDEATMFVKNGFVFIFIGIISYGIFFWVDYFDLKRKKILKTLSWATGLLLHTCAVFGVIVVSNRLELNIFLRYTGYIFSFLFFVLLIYSVFIEIPLYRKRGLSKDSGLVTSGTYSLCRHPGVIWYIGFLISLFIATGSKPMFIAIPLWSTADILYAWYQDRYYFVRIFDRDYLEYKKEVPMFFPRVFRARK